MSEQDVHNAVDAYAAEQEAAIAKLTTDLAVTTDALDESEAEYAAHMKTHDDPTRQTRPTRRRAPR